MDIYIKNIGAVSDGKTKCTEIIQRAIDLVSETGGRVVISDGVYLSGKLIMKSGVELHIAEGATLLASPDCNDYPEAEGLITLDTKWIPRGRNTAFIFAECCENISITGAGTVDCNGHSFVEPLEAPGIHGWSFRRIEALTPPRVVFFASCKNIIIENITMVNQPAGWSFWIHNSADVTFKGVRIKADVHYPNNDGIHINCSRDVRISDCDIECGDDAIVVRANSITLRENTPSERVRVSNCTLRSYTNAIRIGWMNDGRVKDCAFENIVINDSNNGIAIHLPYRKRTIENIRIADPRVPVSTDIGREETLIENLLFKDIKMNRIYKYPVFICIDDNEETLCRDIRDIRFERLSALALNYPYFKGREKKHLGNITLLDCDFTVTDELDGERSRGEPMVKLYADGVRFVNTELK